MKQLPIPATIEKYWAFRGGLDQVSPSIAVPPGVLRSSINLEVNVNGAYRVTDGYERFDGHASPSEAVYYIISCTITGTPTVGNSVTGGTSAATAVIVASTSTSLILTKMVGSFVSGETLSGGGATIVTTSTATRNGASTGALHATYRNLAADEYRDDISAVPGEDSILGVWKYDGAVYAIRNAVGGATANMYKSSGSGWTLVDLGQMVAFNSGGTTEITEGVTITGATSSVNGVVTKVILTSGTWAGGNAAGFIHYTTAGAGFNSGENLNIGMTSNVATTTTTGAAVVLAPDGRYEFVTHNFGGLAGASKVYGASGVHKAFEFDGTNFAYISTGMVADTPTHICVHKNHLFLMFGNSVQHSSIGDPFAWSVVLGAGEINIGDTGTGFLYPPGSSDTDALIINARNSAKVLYGSSSEDWTLSTLSSEIGAIEWTQQWFGQGVSLDDRGITLTSTSQNFGNFAAANIAQQVQPYLSALRNNAVASCIVRVKNQYRLFFNAGAGLYITFVGGKPAGFMPISLTDFPSCMCSLEAADGVEEVFFGAENGYVYQMDKGTSHDGDAMSWSCQLAYNHFGSPMMLKTYRKAVVEVSGGGYAEFAMTYSIGYGTTDLPQDVSTDISTTLSGAEWDSAVWDEFYWDGQTLIPGEADLDGAAENIALSFAGSSDKFDSITLNGAIVAYTARRSKR